MAKKHKKPPTAIGSTSPVAPSIDDAGPTTFGGPMDPLLVERFIKLMSENDVSSLEVSDGPHRVCLKRGPQGVAYAAPVPQMVAPSVAPSMPASSQGAKPPAAPAEEDVSNLKPVKSPMVGTFYASPSPDAKPFVQVGSVVNEETDICVIEAMKVFNNIKAETRGTIAKVLVENGKTVEFGTVLFLVKP